MFAKRNDGTALCLQEYGHIKAGAIVPQVNELWSEVESWLATNGGYWADMPPEDLAPIAASKRSEIEQGRKDAEAEGVTVNGVRYSGDASNRQALKEAIDFASRAGVTHFPSWKDSDDSFHANHPVADVDQALITIGHRRGLLIAREGELVAAINAATTSDEIAAIEWSFTE